MFPHFYISLPGRLLTSNHCQRFDDITTPGVLVPLFLKYPKLRTWLRAPKAPQQLEVWLKIEVARQPLNLVVQFLLEVEKPLVACPKLSRSSEGTFCTRWLS